MAASRGRLWTCFAAAWGVAFLVYAPALNGPFVYDDTVQRYAKPDIAAQPLVYWLSGLRPMLNFSFWLNHIIFGDQPLGYHLFNIAIHVLNSALVFLIARRLLKLYCNSVPAWKLNLLTGFAAVVFLLHPLQTESVAYIASRSETLCGLFMLAAIALFLYRLPGTMNWPDVAALALLTIAACATKEHAVVLLPVLLLADLFWNVDFSVAALRRNWRLYLPLGVTGLAAGVAVLLILGHSLSAGFGLREFTWSQYFFTECRVFFSYLGLFILPIGQTLSPDVPVSRTILDHGSIFGLIGIIGLVAAALYFRRRYRLASFGILLFIILLAPTSSFIPLLEPQVEHRLYLPTLALTLVVVEFLLRARMRQVQMAALFVTVAVALGGMSYARNQVWGDEVLLWKDALEKAPNSQAPYYNVAIALINQRRCNEAEQFLAKVPSRFDRDVPMLTLRGRTEECVSKFDEAARLLSTAAEITPRASLYLRIGLIRSRQGKTDEAYQAFDRAIELEPYSRAGYVLRGELNESVDRMAAAISDFQHALQLGPVDGKLLDHVTKMQRQFRFGGMAQVNPARPVPLRP